MTAATAGGVTARRSFRLFSGKRPPALLLAAGLASPLLVLLPLAATVSHAVQAGAGQAAELLFRPLVGELLFNTVALVAATTAAAAAIGTAAAWFVERTRLPGRRAFAVLAAVPLAIPAFITSFAWVSISPALQDFAGALLVVTSAYYPLVYLPVAAALRGMDPALEETARSLGQGSWSCFYRVVLPQIRPALLGGMLLVALNTLTEFGAFALLRFRTFTTEIYAEYRTSFNGPGASLLACVLLLLCLVCLAAEIKARGRAGYSRVARGARRVAAPYELGWARLPVLAGFVALVAATLGVPLITIIYWMTQHSAAAISPVAVSASSLLSATFSSVSLGLIGAGATTLLAFPITFLAIRYNSPLIALAERTTYLAQGIPSIVVALALVTLTVHAIQPLYQSAALLIVAYAILFLPLAMVAISGALVHVQRSLEEAGRTLGLSPIRTAWRVTIPLAGPGLGAAAALVFASIMTELTATLLLAPIGTRTLATQVWADTSSVAFAAAAPYAALMTLMSLLSTWLLARQFGRAGGLASI